MKTGAENRQTDGQTDTEANKPTGKQEVGKREERKNSELKVKTKRHKCK